MVNTTIHPVRPRMLRSRTQYSRVTLGLLLIDKVPVEAWDVPTNAGGTDRLEMHALQDAKRSKIGYIARICNAAAHIWKPGVAGMN